MRVEPGMEEWKIRNEYSSLTINVHVQLLYCRVHTIYLPERPLTSSMKELQNSSSAVPTECQPHSTWLVPATQSHQCDQFPAWTGSSWPCAQRKLPQSCCVCSYRHRQRRIEGFRLLGHTGAEERGREGETEGEGGQRERERKQ